MWPCAYSPATNVLFLNATRNQAPNSRGSESARQTRARGALSRISRSMRSVDVVIVDVFICNLLVAYIRRLATTSNILIAYSRPSPLDDFRPGGRRGGEFRPVEL